MGVVFFKKKSGMLIFFLAIVIVIVVVISVVFSLQKDRKGLDFELAGSDAVKSIEVQKMPLRGTRAVQLNRRELQKCIQMLNSLSLKPDNGSLREKLPGTATLFHITAGDKRTRVVIFDKYVTVNGKENYIISDADKTAVSAFYNSLRV